ncbi:uncharacterized protein [Palaemon carinicauda]|uniref:uncharacterized protein n=1 Tax=Palaemon carinicauda TaxID=392227 RepID=UPI0035B66DE7
MLTTADRCALLVIQALACLGLVGGLSMWMNKGYSASAVIFVATGGSITVTIMGGLLWTTCRKQDSNTSPDVDPPPKYRLTWRKEFLKSIPDHLKADIDENFGLKKKRKDRKRKSTQVIWTSEVHPVTELPVGASRDVGSLEQDPSGSPVLDNRRQNPAVIAGIHGRSYSMPSQTMYLGHQYSGRSPARSFTRGASPMYDTHIDDGLPSYEDVERWF